MTMARVMVYVKLLGLFALYAAWVMIALWLSAQIFMGGSMSGYVPVGFIVGYIVLILAPIWLYGKWQDRGPGWLKKVQADGKQAIATIVKIGDTGITINNTRREILVQLRVEPLDGEPFEVIQQKEFSWFGGGYSEGEHLQVKYDPNNRKHLIILDQNSFGSSSNDRHSASANAPSRHASLPQLETKSPPADLARDLADLSKLHQSGELSDSEFEDAKRQILGK